MNRIIFNHISILIYLTSSYGYTQSISKLDLILELNEPAKVLIQLHLNKKVISLNLLSSHFNLYRLETPDSSLRGEVIKFLNTNGIRFQNNFQISALRSVNDPLYYKQWQFSQTSFNTYDIDLDIEDAWQFTRDGVTSANDTVVIAIVDNGVLMDHEDLISNIWHNSLEIPNNNIDDDENGYTDDYWGWNTIESNDNIDFNGIGNYHGTPVAGIIGATGGNGVGVSGVNRKIKLMNIVKGQDVASIIVAYDYILNMRRLYNSTKGKKGAFVVAVNNSWGKERQSAINNPLWCSMYDALGEAGILSIVSAPNANIDIDQYSDMPSDCQSDFIISVTNTNKLSQKVNDAGYGYNTVDLGSPGSNSYTTSNLGDYTYFGGTSAAAPFVTGAIGLLYSVESPLMNSEVNSSPESVALKIKSFILNGVVPIADLSGKTVSGGRLNIFNSLVELADHYNLSLKTEDSVPLFEVINITQSSFYTSVYVTFKLSKKIDVSYNLYTPLGKLIESIAGLTISKGINKVEINGSGLQPGVYIIGWSIGETKYSSKFIKTNY